MLNFDFAVQAIPQSSDLRGFFPKLKNPLPIGSTPSRLLHQEASLSVLKYTLPDAVPQKHAVPILLVPSLINRHYILDLLPGKSLVEYLLNQGFQVYLIRWESPEDEDRWLTANRLIGGRIHRAIGAVLKDADIPRIHLVGHCLGGTLCAAYAIRYPERIASLSLLTAPVDFKPVGQLAQWSLADAFDLDAFLEAYGNMPWAVMQTAFQMLKPAAGVTKYIRMLQRITDKSFVRNFAALETWANDNVSFPGGCYKTIIQTFYRDNGLMNGSLQVNGRGLALRQLGSRVMSLSSREDPIVPSETTLQRSHLGEADNVTLIEAEGGHIGCLLGGRAQKQIWPQIADWLGSATLP